MDIAASARGLALATAIGLLIGAERGWRMRHEEPGTRVAGVRTFALLGLLGGLATIASAHGLGALAFLVLLGAIAMLLIGYHSEMRSAAHLSATSAIAGVTTILLGGLAAAGYMALACVGAGAAVALLASREALHGAIGRTSQAEMTALLRLALVTFLILPILPDADIGPWGGINPRRIWFVVVVVGAISFGGYVLARWQGGRRGPLMAALVGALVSSTAVTIEAARRIRESGTSPADDGAVSLASTIMLVRVIVLTLAIAPAVAGDLLRLLGPALAVSLVVLALSLKRALAGAGERETVARPPSLALAFLFAGLVAALSFGARWAGQRYGSESGALVIALGGMVDVDSSVAAVGALPAGTLAQPLAALAIVGPVLFNTLLKLGVVLAVAGRRAGLAAASLAVTALAIFAGVGWVWF
ncbi:DUF4010 domain-containing protein [Novosphingobium sp. G106]|uniref:MgtC/SapB family protein n=1 Tax=Novosphingobium sp. G106 TaxID=2849500 RepID=UPI001C2DDFB0|nr:DUF4010 domain-containing protein [Novosphingobium sp. G106]MBV1691939.1 DUF4010 domain-containing protein [Novosphingobium sp. G106]